MSATFVTEKEEEETRAWWHRLIVLQLGSPRQDCEFEASLPYTVGLYLNNDNKPVQKKIPNKQSKTSPE